MRKRVVMACSLLFMTVTGVTACGSAAAATAAKIDGLDNMGTITAITREEGSGTRGVFAEKTNLENKENSSNADLIRSDAQIAMNADAVIEAVAADENAIGYVSLGAITSEVNGIKVLGVNGVTPGSTTIANGKYPLTRNLNIAYSGKISEEGNDFLTYILSAGQDIVAESYTTVKDADSFLSDKSEGTLKISGSSSTAPLLEALAEDYNANYNANLVIDVQTTDSTSGLTAAMQGSSDWGMASRELKDYEKELLTYETIAKDGVAVIVNSANPAETLTVDQLTQIFDGTDQQWSDVNQ